MTGLRLRLRLHSVSYTTESLKENCTRLSHTLVADQCYCTETGNNWGHARVYKSVFTTRQRWEPAGRTGGSWTTSWWKILWFMWTAERERRWSPATLFSPGYDQKNPLNIHKFTNNKSNIIIWNIIHIMNHLNLQVKIFAELGEVLNGTFPALHNKTTVFKSLGNSSSSSSSSWWFSV